MAEQAVLLAASVLVWVLLLWSIAVAGALIAAGLPGLPGRCGRILLRRIAPAAAGRLLAAAVGVSLLAGTSACAAPWAAGSQPDGSTATSSSAAESSATPTITIDWPDSADSAADLAPAAAPSPTTPTAMPPPTTSSGLEETTPKQTATAPTAAADQAAPAPTDTAPPDTAPTDSVPPAPPADGTRSPADGA
ncbi:MAG: hypothetical protein ABWZ02_05335, partial [Nakamurella sp.]